MTATDNNGVGVQTRWVLEVSPGIEIVHSGNEYRGFVGADTNDKSIRVTHYPMKRLVLTDAGVDGVGTNLRTR